MSSNRKTGKSSKAQFDETRGTNDVSALGLRQVIVTSYIKTRQVSGNSNDLKKAKGRNVVCSSCLVKLSLITLSCFSIATHRLSYAHPLLYVPHKQVDLCVD